MSIRAVNDYCEQDFPRTAVCINHSGRERSCLQRLESLLVCVLTTPFGLAWVFVVLGDSYDLDTHSWNPDGIRVIRQQDFWFAFGMTVL